MAINELEKRTEEVRKEREKKYHLTEIRNNREEIRKMGERCATYAVEIYPELESIPDWSVAPVTTIEFVKQVYQYLAKMRKKEMQETFLDFGKFARFSIEFGVTETADGDATFNPKITVMEEMTYDNENPENNKISMETPVIDMSSDIESVAVATSNNLKALCDLHFEDWRGIVQVVAAFFRVVKEYLIEHKDDNPYGITINFAEVLDLCIEKYNEEDDKVGYAINFGPGKELKLTS